MNSLQGLLQAMEVGRAQIMVRVVPLIAALFVVAGAYDFVVFRGLNDAQSMDNAQLARQIVRHEGFTTEFIRPQALSQLRSYASETLKSGNLFPLDRFPPGTPRIIPDTYNAPGYPCLLAAWYLVSHPEFEQVATTMSTSHFYSADRVIPVLNQIFLVLTGILVFALGRRLFDERVAWLSLLAFLGTDLMWRLTLSALSTMFAMFLVTGTLLCVLEIICIGEACFDNEDRSFGPAWIWGFAAAGLLGLACLTRLDLLVLLLPLLLFLLIMPHGSFPLAAAITLIVMGMVAPWFWHEFRVCGNPLGSNFALLLYGEGDYTGNQIYCGTSIPGYEHLFGFFLKKETTGLRWHFDHGWNLLGANPLIFLFGASILHPFKRRRTRLFHWMLFCAAAALILVNNLSSPTPEAVGPWNTIVLLFPCMVVFGSAFFFILLDRLNVQMRLLSNLIVTSTVVFMVLPMIQTIATPNLNYYAFPPYMPPLIKSLGQYAEPDEWVTSDMPWATAWYADRSSLWLPDSMADFQNFYDNVCPTGIIILTPQTWEQPVATFTTGEYKDWYGLTAGLQAYANQPNMNLPASFPLSVHTMTAPGGPDYAVWSDRPRWQEK